MGARCRAATSGWPRADRGRSRRTDRGGLMKSRDRKRPVADGVSRRDFLGRAGAFTGAVMLGPAILAACGGDDDDSSSGSGGGGGGGGSKSLAISNWTGYMSQTALKRFEQQTGIKVDYAEDIND